MPADLQVRPELRVPQVPPDPVAQQEHPETTEQQVLPDQLDQLVFKVVPVELQVPPALPAQWVFRVPPVQLESVFRGFLVMLELLVLLVQGVQQEYREPLGLLDRVLQARPVQQAHQGLKDQQAQLVLLDLKGQLVPGYPVTLVIQELQVHKVQPVQKGPPELQVRPVQMGPPEQVV